MTTGPPIVSPSTLAIRGARARAISSKKIACSISVAPAPPYSVGQVSPAQPRSLSLRCHSMLRSNAASSSPAGPGLWSAIHVRSSSRNSSSAGLSERSIYESEDFAGAGLESEEDDDVDVDDEEDSRFSFCLASFLLAPSDADFSSSRLRLDVP